MALGVAEHRVGPVGEEQVPGDGGHLPDRLDVAGREFALITVGAGHAEGLEEDVDGGDVVSEIQLELHPVGIDLHADLAVENLDAAATPLLRFAELREIDAREQHPLGFEQQVVALLGVVVQDVVGVLAVGAQEEVEEPGREARRMNRQRELRQQVLQTASGLHRTPCEADVLLFGGDFGRGSSRSLQPFDAVQRVFLHPVGVLVHPGVDVFRVARGVVTLGQRNEPVVAVQLPAQFVVLHGPVAPVDVVAVEIRGLVALVGVEFVLQGFVGLLLLELVHLDVLQVEAEEFDGLARAEIFQQFLVRGGDVAFGDGFLHGLHARTFEVQQVVERLFVAQSRGGSGGRCRAERQCGAEGHQDSFHGCYFRLYFVPLILTCSRFPRQTASTRCPAASSAGSSTVTSRTGFPARFRTVKA